MGTKIGLVLPFYGRKGVKVYRGNSWRNVGKKYNIEEPRSIAYLALVAALLQVVVIHSFGLL